MSNQKDAWVVHESNSAVTRSYQDTIALALAEIGYKIHTVSAEEVATGLFPKASKGDVIVTCTWISFIKVYLRGYKSVILWCQGIIPEESYMRNKSAARFWLLSHFEKYSLKNAAYILCVSDAMREHYEQKYSLDLGDKTYVMPCFNTTFNEWAFQDHSRYSHPSFTYVGSLAPWQCFDETLMLYKTIEAQIPDAFLHVFTPDGEEAKKRAEAQQIRNYHIQYVEPSLLDKELSKISYGFVLRKDVPVNRVATPTKLSSYISCGVIPIFSECLTSFAKATTELQHKLVISDINSSQELIEFASRKRQTSEVEKEYRKLFNTYYNRDQHIKDLAQEFAKVFLR